MCHNMLAIIFSIGLIGSIGATGVGFYALSKYRPSLYNRMVQILFVAPFVFVAAIFVMGQLSDFMTNYHSGGLSTALESLQMEKLLQENEDYTNENYTDYTIVVMKNIVTHPVFICVFLGYIASLVSKVFFVSKNDESGGDKN